MHLDPARFMIDLRDMRELSEVKVGVKFAIDASQQVQIKGRCYSELIIVGRNQLRAGLFQVRSHQQGVAGLQNSSNLCQELQAREAFEVSDGTPQEQHQELLTALSVRGC